MLNEKEIKNNLCNIENDEIINFIRTKYLSLRFFNHFLTDYKKSIESGESVFHLLLKYYQQEKFYNIDPSTIEDSVFNISRFPNCLNDWELLLQKKKVNVS